MQARRMFFSSRRRHTRCSRDWSSDVCSSDLGTSSALPPRKRCHAEVITWNSNGCLFTNGTRRRVRQRNVRTRRSEEHTSELQSRLHLVCRLLLEKKKIKTSRQPHLHN